MRLLGTLYAAQGHLGFVVVVLKDVLMACVKLSVDWLFKARW